MAEPSVSTFTFASPLKAAMEQGVNAVAAVIAFVALAWLMWPAVRKQLPSPTYAVIAGLGTGLLASVAFGMSGGRWDVALAVGLVGAAIDIAGLMILPDGVRQSTAPPADSWHAHALLDPLRPWRRRCDSR